MKYNDPKIKYKVRVFKDHEVFMSDFIDKMLNIPLESIVPAIKYHHDFLCYIDLVLKSNKRPQKVREKFIPSSLCFLICLKR